MSEKHDTPYLYAIGFDDLQVEHLRKNATRPPGYTIAVNGDDVKLSLDEFAHWSRFRKAILAALNFDIEVYAPKGMKPQSAWEHIRAPLLAGITVYQVPLSATREGILLEALRDWLTGLTVADEDIQLDGGAVLRERKTDGRFVVRLKHVYAMADQAPGLRGMTSTDIWDVLYPLGFIYGTHKVEGRRSTRVMVIPAGFIEGNESDEPAAVAGYGDTP